MLRRMTITRACFGAASIVAVLSLMAGAGPSLRAQGSGCKEFAVGLPNSSVSLPATTMSAATTLNVESIEPAGATWTFATENVPPGMSVTFSPQSVFGRGSTQVRISAGPNVLAGMHVIGLVPLCNGMNVGTLTLTLVVQGGLVNAPTTPSVTPSAVATSAAPVAGTPTTLAGSEPGQWLDRPLAAAGAAQTCPASGQWLLLYWAGATGARIAMVASVCPSADRYWLYRGGQWLGFAAGLTAASDSWDIQRGEAHFVHGR